MRDLLRLEVPRVGRLHESADPGCPVTLFDPQRREIAPVSEYMRDLLACGRVHATLRSYGHDLLRWFRFLWAVDVGWARATRVEARDYSVWLIAAKRPVQPLSAAGYGAQIAGGKGFQPTTRAHSETALRQFYEFHLELGSGPIINPFPLARGRGEERANSHHSPLQPLRNERVGRYRPRLARRSPRGMPDDIFDQVFAQLPSNRDRAMVSFYISTGARASELLGACRGDVYEGEQLIAVTRKGSRQLQRLPASSDAFVWLRLYQQEMKGLIPAQRGAPLWWTVRRPFRPLSYHGAHRMFERVNALLGLEWTLHSLRHAAAYRMARDPLMPLTDVQWVLGHAHLSTTQLYTVPHEADVIASVLGHHARLSELKQQARPVLYADGYHEETMNVLFGR